MPGALTLGALEIVILKQQDRSLSVVYISCMWLTYYSREGRCEHSGGLGVAYVSQMIETEACEGYDWLLDSLKTRAGGLAGCGLGLAVCGPVLLTAPPKNRPSDSVRSTG
jgi:hypothetical protein